MNVTTNNAEVILKLESHVEALEKNVKIAKKFLNFIDEKECSTYTWSYISKAKKYLCCEAIK